VNKQYILFRSAFAAAALGMALPAGAANEESKEKEAPSASVLDKIMVVGNPANIEEMPGSAYVVTKKDIREQNYDDVNRVLRKVPGVYVREEDGFGLFSNISLRGVDTTRSAKVTVMEDGVLTAPAPYSAPAAYYTPTMGRMSGLEILKGSSQIKYGPQTTGGVINYLSTPIPLKKTAYFKSSYGSYGDVRTHVYAGDTIDTKAGQFGALAEVYFRQNDGYKTIDSTPNLVDKNSGFAKTEPMIKLSWEPSTNMYQRFEFKYGRSNLDANETYLGLSEADFKADPNRRYSASRFDNIKSQQDRSYLRYAVAPTDDIDVIATVYQNTFSRNWYKLGGISGVDVGGTPTSFSLGNALTDSNGLNCLRGDTACTLKVKANNRDYKTQGVDITSYARFATGTVEHEIATGIRANYDRIRRYQWQDEYTQAADGGVSDMTFGTKGDAGNRLQKTTAIAAFAQDSISAGDWNFTPGVRFEQLDQTYIDYSKSGTAQTNKMNMLAASFGTTYRFNESLVGFGSVNRGFSPPSPKSAIGGNKEETSNAYELGARYTNADQALAVETVAFYTQFNDLIVIDNVGGAGSGEDGNFGRVDSAGLELSAQYDAGIANNWTKRNPWYVTATYTNAIQKSDAVSTDAESIFSYGKIGNRVPYIPKLVLSAGTGVESKDWGIFVTGTYVTATYTSANNVSNQVNGDGNPDARYGTTDAYFVADVSANYRINEGLKLFGGVQNLANNAYNVSRQPYGPRPGMPLFAYSGIEMDL